MKNLILPTLATVMFVLTVTTTMTAQEKYDIKIRPLSLLAGDFKTSVEYLNSNRLTYEMNLAYRGGRGIVFGDNVGFQGSFQTNSQGNQSNSSLTGIYQERGFDVGLGVRYYFSPRTTADGFYANIYTDLTLSTHSQNDEKLFRNTQLVTGGLLGYKKVYSSGFFMEGAAGLGWAVFYKNSLIDGSGFDLAELNPLKIKLPVRFAVGIRF